MWSEDRVVTLKRLWADGLTASQIAKKLGGVTRNAVIGKVHRMGLPRRESLVRAFRAPRPPRPRAAPTPPWKPPVLPKPEKITPRDPLALAAEALLSAARIAEERRDGMRRSLNVIGR